jgi:hypothetical protein
MYITSWIEPISCLYTNPLAVLEARKSCVLKRLKPCTKSVVNQNLTITAVSSTNVTCFNVCDVKEVASSLGVGLSEMKIVIFGTQIYYIFMLFERVNCWSRVGPAMLSDVPHAIQHLSTSANIKTLPNQCRSQNDKCGGGGTYSYIRVHIP